MRANFKVKLLSVALLGLLSACWEIQEFQVLRQVPGTIPLPGAHNLAVGEITGPDGGLAGHLLAQALMQQNAYRVFDWSGSYGGRGGRMGDSGADAVILGSMQQSTVTPLIDAYTERAYDGSEVTTYTRTVTLSVVGRFRVVDPQTGAIIASSTAVGDSTMQPESVTFAGAAGNVSGQTLESYFTPLNIEGMQNAAVGALVEHLSGLFVSTYESVRVALYHDSSQPELKRALAGAREGYWNDAVRVYGEACNAFTRMNPSLAYQAHYNYGVALAFSGDLDGGIREMRHAQSLSKQSHIARMLDQLQNYRISDERKLHLNEARR